MKILGIVLWIVGALIAGGWMYGIRYRVWQGVGITQQTVNTTLLFVISLAGVVLLPVSNFHLLWLFPLSVVVGILSFAFPLSLLSIPGHLFGLLCTLGLNQAEVAKNTARLDRFEELKQAGLSPEEARETVFQEYGRT